MYQINFFVLLLGYACGKGASLRAWVPYIARWVHVFVRNVGRCLLGRMQILLQGSNSYFCTIA
jgi:hypothetical protein